MVLSDRIISSYLMPILVIVFILYMIPAGLTISLYFYTSNFTIQEPDALLFILERYTKFEGLPNSITTTLIQSLPALIGAICYRRLSNIKINLYAQILFWALVIGCLSSILSLFLLDPNDKSQTGNVIIGEIGLERLHDDCEASLRAVITYILLFLGLQVPVRQDQKLPNDNAAIT